MVRAPGATDHVMYTWVARGPSLVPCPVPSLSCEQPEVTRGRELAGEYKVPLLRGLPDLFPSHELAFRNFFKLS